MARLSIPSNYNIPYRLAIKKVFSPSIRDLLENGCDTDTSFIRELQLAICATEKKIRVTNLQIILLKNLRKQFVRRQVHVNLKVWRRAFRDIDEMKKLILRTIKDLYCGYRDALLNLLLRLCQRLFISKFRCRISGLLIE